MPELRDATVVVGIPGLNGTGVTAPEKTAINNDLTALKAITYITKTASATTSGEIALDTLGGPGLLKVAADGTLSIALAADLPAHTSTVAFTMQFSISSGDPATSITTGQKPDAEICIPAGCTITDYSFVGTPKTGQTSGTATLSLWVDSHTNYPPTSGDKITASAPLTITTSVKNVTNSRTGWTNTLLASNFIRPNVESNDNFASLRATLFLTREV